MIFLYIAECLSVKMKMSNIRRVLLLIVAAFITFYFYYGHLFTAYKLNSDMPSLTQWFKLGNRNTESETTVMCFNFNSMQFANESTVKIIGKLDVTKRYAVYSTTTENENAMTFIFLLPLTALTWTRVGFSSVVMVVGSADTWNANPLLRFVLTSLLQLNSIVIFLHPKAKNSVMISQMSRIYAASILQSALPVKYHRSFSRVYLISSDADLWPISKDYVLQPGKLILSLNSECCGDFKHGNSSYRMRPMSNIGMQVSTWLEVTPQFDDWRNSINHIIRYCLLQFGPEALLPVIKGENVGWFMDQRTISILLARWEQKNSRNESVRYVPRNTRLDRIDRSNWNVQNSSLDTIFDAHLLLDGHTNPDSWSQLNHLLLLMLGDTSFGYQWAMHYYVRFQQLRANDTQY